MKVRVEIGMRGYDVLVGSGLLGEAGKHLQQLGCDGKALVVTSAAVRKLFGAKLEESLKEHDGFATCFHLVPDGEQAKSLDEVEKIYAACVKQELTRDSAIIALGGGTVGDVAGFAAATFKRGMQFVQLPTTLLAQVDSSVGGKTGVNYGGAKNLVGAFHQPKLVLADVSALETLPRNQLASGMAEVVKYGVIADAGLFSFVESNTDEIMHADQECITRIVAESCKIKAKIVGEDEREETGKRMLLNYGHTIGHAIEAVTGLLHGEAVSIGMAAAARISRSMGVLSARDEGRQNALLTQLGLPLHAKADSAKVLELLKQDKKRSGEKNRFVLAKQIGEAFVSEDVPEKTVAEAVDAACMP